MGAQLSSLAAAVTKTYPAVARRESVVRDAAVLDVAFDHLLYGLHERGVYEVLDLTLKGGTALRKYHLGHRSRFSFDLDFDAEEGVAELVAEEIDGMAFPHFEFTAHERRGHYSTHVATDLLPVGGGLRATMDFSSRGLWLPAEQRGLVPTPVQAAYPFDPGFPIPVMRVDENVAEKLGRWQERPLVRDLYDLAALSTSIGDPQLVARMWVLKCHAGMTSGIRRGSGPAASVDELTADKHTTPFVLRSLVLPTDPPDTAKQVLVEEYLAKVDGLCRTVADHMTPDLYRYADDRGALSWEVGQEIAEIEASFRNERSRGRDQGGYPSFGW
ncbi:MAG: nucleotidyl transferase AbiEii/AbiGii toxin family protein [bacterium]|nr:nucleotidyl transferase AbiEii/AbiGii toxin family protein [bacterium]MDE0290720.1 nucleotidyl transferase AbiEii/AbiGii toxin family protein [bacterium]MDE0437676.1 nucleotidyl transferase AbiEii/AbiGii toxin family protein [bacterium]